ncbi:MAG: hypothetical protein JWQ66_1694 [Mucilaginibacter sp.]|jgi:hypothetical protein|nr:hypothetical protein [Mucilaginibacter sp.]
MINKLIYLLIAFSFITKAGYSQILGHADSLSREKSEVIVKNNFRNLIGNKYLLFSISDRWYLIIAKKSNKYYEYYLDSDTSKVRRSSTIKATKVVSISRVLSKAFDEKSYQKDYITFNSPFYRHNHAESDGNITYFYLMIDGVKYGEARLSVFIKPNPIDKDVYDYLRISLLRYISK